MEPELLDGLKYTKEHEWLRVEEHIGVVGITDYAQDQLGDVVHVELPYVDDTCKQFDYVVLIDSMKASSEVYAPVSGTITEINSTLEESPELVNKSPYESAWLIKIKIEDPEELNNLLDIDQYRKLLATEG